jgi:hypothetical protein
MSFIRSIVNVGGNISAPSFASKLKLLTSCDAAVAGAGGSNGGRGGDVNILSQQYPAQFETRGLILVV